jgi:hypothetical protein
VWSSLLRVLASYHQEARFQGNQADPFRLV